MRRVVACDTRNPTDMASSAAATARVDTRVRAPANSTSETPVIDSPTASPGSRVSPK